MDSNLLRQIQKFQNKVQTNINIADDEIRRLRSYYNSLQAQIAEYKDLCQQINTASERRYHEDAGQIYSKKASQKISLNTICADHNATLKSLQEQQAFEIQTLQLDFAQTMAEVDTWGKQIVEQQTSSLDSEISKLRGRISSLSTTRSRAPKQETDRTDLEIDSKILSHLQSEYLNKAKDRLDLLVEHKDRLYECVTLVEEEQESHIRQMRFITSELEKLDRKHNSDIEKITKAHQKETSKLKRETDRIESANERIENEFSQARRTNSSEMATMTNESDYLQKTIQSSTKQIPFSSYSISSTERYRELTIQSQKLDAKLAQKENQLIAVRTRNESLIREVERLRHENEIARRQSAISG